MISYWCHVEQHLHATADSAELCRLRTTFYGPSRTTRRSPEEVALEKRRLAEARSKRKEFFARRRATKEARS